MSRMAGARKPVAPRERMRRLLIDAAHEQLRDGGPLTVQAVAERAGVSRATAYRYFPNNDSVLLHATIPNPAGPADDPDWPYAAPDPTSPLPDRVADLVRGLAAWAFDHQRELTTVMALSLQPDAEERGLSRSGRLSRYHWIDQALTDLPAHVTPDARRRLELALLPLFGADAVVWTTHVAHLDREAALDQLAWMARTMVDAVVHPGTTEQG
jgi:AcrR family transcriptional regulator